MVLPVRHKTLRLIPACLVEAANCLPFDPSPIAVPGSTARDTYVRAVEGWYANYTMYFHTYHSLLVSFQVRAKRGSHLHLHLPAGTLPPEFALFTNAHILHLAGNFLTGEISAAYFTASAFRYSTFLYLYLNNLTGPLPALTPSSCALCSPRETMPNLPQVDPGTFSGLVLEPMRAGYGAPVSGSVWFVTKYTMPGAEWGGCSQISVMWPQTAQCQRLLA